MSAPLASRASQFVRTGSPRFSALYIAGFLSGSFFVAHEAPPHLLLWIIYWITFCVSVEWLNRLVDLPADRINQPLRTRWALSFGTRGLRRAAFVAWFSVMLLSTAMVALSPSDAPSKTALAVVLVVNITIGIGYSFGRVTKRYPGATIALLTATLVMPWVTGIAAGNRTLSSEQWRVAVAVAVLLATVSVIIAGAKDLTDRRGDTLIGYRSVWLTAVENGAGRTVLITALVQFTVAAITVTQVGLSVFLACSIIAAGEVSVILGVRRARTLADAIAVREHVYLVTLASVVSIGIAVNQSLQFALVAGACVIAWILMSLLAHWNKHLSRKSASHMSALLWPRHSLTNDSVDSLA